MHNILTTYIKILYHTSWIHVEMYLYVLKNNACSLILIKCLIVTPCSAVTAVGPCTAKDQNKKRKWLFCIWERILRQQCLFWEGGLTSSLISLFFRLSFSVSHPAHRNAVSSSAQTMTAQRTLLSCGHVPFVFFFLFQDFKETNNKCGEMLWQALNVIIQGSE